MKRLRSDALDGLYEWDQWLMVLAEGYDEYQALRHERIDRAVRWLVQRALTPS